MSLLQINIVLEEAVIQQVIEVNGVERWAVYRRLQEIEIPCSCSINQPLTAIINSPIALVQLWSVLRCCTSSRQEMILFLQKCWYYNF